MSGEVVHFEIPYDKGDRAKKFYSDVFGWKVREETEMDYTTVMTSPVDDKGRPTQPGMINGGMAKRKAPLKEPVVTIAVNDIEQTLKHVAEAGGKPVKEKYSVGEMGWAAYFKDTEGNVIGLWQSNPKMMM